MIMILDIAMTRFWMTLIACSLMTAVGCNSESEFTDYELAPEGEHTHEGHDHHDHEGAHGGHVIEFDAAHAHHAELVFDETSRDITLYFYGAEIGSAHPAEGLVVELEEGDEEIHLEVAAAPLDGETEEAASCYVVAGANVPEAIKSAEDLHGHFHVTLDGQDFKGDLSDHEDHNHEHEEHHEHGDDEDHDHHDEDHDHDEDKDGEE
jgi:hypothetical protein